MGKNSFTTKEENRPQKPEKKPRKSADESSKQSRSLVQIMNGEFLTRDFVVNNLNYIFFIIFLMVLMVSKGYYVHQLATDIAKEEKDLEDVTADYVETKAKLEEMTRRTQMIERLAPLGLKETVNPTKVIRVNNKEEK